MAFTFSASKIGELLRALKLTRRRVLVILCPYYVLTLVNAFLEGIGMVLLVAIFTGAVGGEASGGLPPFVGELVGGFRAGTGLAELLPILLIVFGVSFVVRFGLLVFDGVMSAFLRQRLQEEIFSRYLLGDWSHMRNFRVGDAVGTNTQEAMIVAKYLVSAVLAVYFVLSATVMSGLALVMSLQISLALGLIALPLVLLMQKTFAVQARLSKNAATLRNEFSGDIADRFNGLLQVHIDDSYDFHRRQGLRAQQRLTRLEVLIGVCAAVIGSFNVLLPLTVLVGFSLWILIMGTDRIPDLALVAGVGVLGIRVATQVNGAVASLGNLSRLSGSLYPVLAALNVPAAAARCAIDRQVVRVELRDVSYFYGSEKVLDGITLTAHKGTPLLLSGRSGRGKTTLANLIAGLYLPSSGCVVYVDAFGDAFDSTRYRARVGLVPQDIYLFQGSLRSNLTAGRTCSDQQIWAALEQVDAAQFVSAMGGIDTESAEAGRSLSGGQRRRLGIARVLLSGSEILIFDEVTAGLDTLNRAAVIRVMERLSAGYIVVIISHEELHLRNHAAYAV